MTSAIRNPVVLATLAAVLTAAGFAYHGTSDVDQFLTWAEVFVEKNPFRGYPVIADYPPLGPPLIWAAVALGRLVPLPYLAALKLDIFVFQFAAAVIAGRRFGLPAGVLLLLLIAPFGALLGYIDCFYLPFILLGLFAMEARHPATACLYFVIATLIKWQPAILCPLVFIQALSLAAGRDRLLMLLPAAAFAILVIAAFGPAAVWHAFAGATGDRYFSGQAFNLDWIITYLLELFHLAGQSLAPDGAITLITALPFPGYALSRALFWAAYATSLVLFATRPKTQKTFILALLAAESIQFNLNTGVHENHAFLVMILGFVAFQQGHIGKILFALIAALALANILLLYGPLAIAGCLTSVLTSALAAASLAVCATLCHRHATAT